MSLSSRLFTSLVRRQSRGGPGSTYMGFPNAPIGDTAPIGLTAFACAVRLVSETLGSFVMRVYEGDASNRQPLLDAPQAALLQDGAEAYATSMDLWSDVATSVELCGNGFIWKGRKGKVIRELYAFPAEFCRVYVNDSGRKVVEARIEAGLEDITSDVIHVRGWSPTVSVSGSSTTELHQRSLQGSVALEQFRGRYFDADSTPNIVLHHPAPNLPVEERREIRAGWNMRHQGPAGDKTGILWGGITVQQLTANLAESQMAELMTADVLSVARMCRIYPPTLLAAAMESAALPQAEIISDLFHRFTLLHRMRRVERAVSGDRELFPNRKQYARFDSSEFVRGSIEVTASKVHKLKQVGLITANEGRSELGLPPSADPNADKLLVTPVGAGANPNADPPPPEGAPA